jgi:transcriptional regulator with XRE-family HTH domain
MLRGMREKKALGLRDLARKVGMSHGFLSRVESGKQTPPAGKKLRALAQELDCDPDVMLAMSGRLPDDAVTIIQKHPAEYMSFLRLMRNLSSKQLLEAQRTIVKTYRLELPAELSDRWRRLISGLEPVEPYETEFVLSAPKRRKGAAKAKPRQHKE